MIFLLILLSDFWSDFAHIKTPLALAGLFAAIIFLLARQILKNFQPRDPNKRHGFQLARTILMYMFVLSLVAMILGFLGYWLQLRKHSDLTPAETAAVDLEDEIMELKGSYSNIDESPADRQRTVEEGPRLVERLLLINDDQLRPAYRVLKYEYAMYGATMVAVAQTNNDAKLQYVSTALGLGRRTEELVAEVKRNFTKNDDYVKAVTFIGRDSVEDRVNYLTAVCFCQKASLAKTIDFKIQAEERVAKVSQPFLEKYPIETNADFNDCGGLRWRESGKSY